ncbi:VacJ family lipoprotein [Thermodesulfobacteriota bacterium]
MSEKHLIRLLSLLLLSVFVWTGCAHKPATTSAAISTGSPNQQSPKMDTAQTDPTAQETEMEDEFGDDFFDEEFEEEIITVADPLRPWNRLMFHFNDKLYFWLLKPLAQGYRFLVPELARIGVKNFFHNITTPVRFTNSILQGKGRLAGVELGSFMINSTWGGLGLWNLTQDHPDLKPSDEDLGQTLGYWGLGNGFYIVWPFLGPSTLRDSVGKFGDSFLTPTVFLDEYWLEFWLSLGMNSTRVLNETSFRIGDYEAFKKSAIEPYEAMKDGYLQIRKKKVED